MVLVALAAVILTTSPVLAEWVSRAPRSEVTVRDPIVVADAPDQPTNPTEIDPEGAHVRKVTVSNVSPRVAYMITPRLQVEYTRDERLSAWEGTSPPKNAGSEFGASQWVKVSVFDDAGTHLSADEAIILPANRSKTFTFYVYFTGDAWPGKYNFLPWFTRSEVPAKG